MQRIKETYMSPFRAFSCTHLMMMQDSRCATLAARGWRVRSERPLLNDIEVQEDCEIDQFLSGSVQYVSFPGGGDLTYFVVFTYPN